MPIYGQNDLSFRIKIITDMSTYTQIIYHIVFSTKNRASVLYKENRERLFRYMAGILDKRKCICLSINGVEDHVHILTHIHPTIALSNLIKEIKVGSTLFIKESGLFRGFDHWQDGYGAFTHHWSDKERLVRYVKNQENHHRTLSYKEELQEILKEHGVPWDERYI